MKSRIGEIAGSRIGGGVVSHCLQLFTIVCNCSVYNHGPGYIQLSMGGGGVLVRKMVVGGYRK